MFLHYLWLYLQLKKIQLPLLTSLQSTQQTQTIVPAKNTLLTLSRLLSTKKLPSTIKEHSRENFHKQLITYPETQQQHSWKREKGRKQKSPEQNLPFKRCIVHFLWNEKVFQQNYTQQKLDHAIRSFLSPRIYSLTTQRPYLWVDGLAFFFCCWSGNEWSELCAKQKYFLYKFCICCIS